MFANVNTSSRGLSRFCRNLNSRTDQLPVREINYPAKTQTRNVPLPKHSGSPRAYEFAHHNDGRVHGRCQSSPLLSPPMSAKWTAQVVFQTHRGHSNRRVVRRERSSTEPDAATVTESAARLSSFRADPQQHQKWHGPETLRRAKLRFSKLSLLR